MQTSTPAALALAAHLERLPRDIDAWLALFADDAVVEFPYASGIGAPQRLVGKPAIQNYFTGTPKMFLGLAFRDAEIHATHDPNVAIATVHGSATIATTMLPYEQDYVMFVTCRDDLITEYREYWDPIRGLQALGGPDGVRAMTGAA